LRIFSLLLPAIRNHARHQTNCYTHPLNEIREAKDFTYWLSGPVVERLRAATLLLLPDRCHHRPLDVHELPDFFRAGTQPV